MPLAVRLLIVAPVVPGVDVSAVLSLKSQYFKFLLESVFHSKIIRKTIISHRL
jgi:hypothetical protein